VDLMELIMLDIVPGFNGYYEASYDKAGDVLYITAKENSFSTHTREDVYGIIWRYNKNNKILGATIIDFKEAWRDKIKALSARLIIYLGISVPSEVELMERRLQLILTENV